METPIKRRLFVFSCYNRRRLRNSSGLYVGNCYRGNATRAEDIFVLNAASDCRSQWTRGQHLLISDALEFEPVNLDLWDKYKDDPALKKFRDYVEAVEGDVKTAVVHEDSILGEVTGDLFQEDTQW